MHVNLSHYQHVLVHCKNGRSRSPTVILAYMILFGGLSRDHAMQWLTNAFREQRPTISNHSADFPNFPKFESVLVALEKSCSTDLGRAEIKKRIDKNMLSLSSSSSSPSSPSVDIDTVLCGTPWHIRCIPKFVQSSINTFSKCIVMPLNP